MLNTRIQFRSKQNYKQLWVDETHSFDQLQHFRYGTDLNAFIFF